MNKYEVGVITDSEIGCNFARRLKGNGYSCVLYNTGLERMSRGEINNYVSDMHQEEILTTTSVEIMLNLLKKPRRIFIVSQSKLYADTVLQELYEFSEANDIIIDTCDADYNITTARCRLFEKKDVSYLGVGFSGEAAGGSSISLMVGGSRDAYDEIRDLLKDQSSKFAGQECCAYVGPDGAGQYVKMIHNGIEYGIMQSICESISLLEHVADFDNNIILETFGEWSIGENESFLMQIAYEILTKNDSATGEFFKNTVSDKVGNGKSVLWLCESAAELSEPVPSIYASLNNRFLSGLKKERTSYSDLIAKEKSNIVLKQRERKTFVTDIKNALYLSLICVHAQAFNLLRRKSSVGIWGTSALDVAITFQGGAYIRSRLLSRIIDAYKNKPDLKNLLEDGYFISTVKRYLPSLQNVIIKAAEGGVSIPVMSSALTYLFALSEETMNTSIIELMRDYVQGTGFELRNSPKEKYSTDWKNVANSVSVIEMKNK
ncbi:MAG: hypothetical protein E7387_02225 [Ruminococcaceae bacterium]|nr:hypothetical protein [Oscillospiraceae bacterium]